LIHPLVNRLFSSHPLAAPHMRGLTCKLFCYAPLGLINT